MGMLVFAAERAHLCGAQAAVRTEVT